MLCCFFLDATITLLFNSKRKILHFFLLQTTKNYHSTIATVFNWIIYTIVPIMNDRQITKDSANTKHNVADTWSNTTYNFCWSEKIKIKNFEYLSELTEKAQLEEGVYWLSADGGFQRGWDGSAGERESETRRKEG